MAEAVRVERTGGPEAMTLATVDTPVPGTGEVLVDVAAAGVNYIDTYQRSGQYSRELPFTLGMEGTGRVAALGDNVGGLAVGDRVAWASAPGSYASQVLVNASVAVPVPDTVTDETAAALPLQGLTAHYLVHSSYQVSSGDTVLVHAAAGGVGLLVTQLASAAGARVLATASTTEKRELAAAAGAAEVYGYEDFASEVRRATGGAGVAAVYDGVGATTFDGSLGCLRRRGTVVLFGAASGPVPPVDPQRLNTAGSVFLTRPTLIDHVATRDELLWRARDLFAAVTSGALDIRVGGRYALAEAATAHRDLEGRATTGKLLLLP